MHGGLPCGIRAANDVHRFALTSQRFGSPAAVINARAVKVPDARKLQGPPLNAHGQQQGVARNLGTVGKPQIPVGALRAETDRLLWRKNLHAEAPRLRNGTPREIIAAEPGRKAEIVLNS